MEYLEPDSVTRLGNVLKVLCNLFVYKSSPKIVFTFGLFEKHQLM